MKLKLIFLLFLVARMAAQTHPWDGIIDPSRAVDWTHAGIPGGIPNYTTVCSSTTAGVTIPIQPSNTGNSTTDAATDTTNINQALKNCGATATASAPIVVQLAAGTFHSNGIGFGGSNPPATSYPGVSYTVLRGAGPDKTIIVSMGNTIGCGQFAYICIQGSNGYPRGGYANSTTWTGTNNVIGTYSKGATILNVGSTAGLSTVLGASGNIIAVDQRADSIGACPPALLGTGTGSICTGVNGAVESGNTVTITTSLPHGFHQGDCVGVSNIGQIWAVGAASWSNATGTGTATLTIGSNNLVTTAAYNPSPPTLTRNQIIVAGVTPASYNGTFNITAVSGNSVSYTCCTVGGVAQQNPGVGSGGTASDKVNGYNSENNVTSTSCATPGNPARVGFFTITAVPTTTTFQYTAERSGLAPGGGNIDNQIGQVGEDTGGVMWNSLVGITSNEGGNSGGRNCPGTKTPLPVACTLGELSNRDPLEYKRVTDICVSGVWQGDHAGGTCSANTIMVDPPIELPMWRSQNAPGIFWNGSYAVGDGIENLTLDMSIGTYSSSSGGIMLYNAARSWIKNIRSINGNRNHIWSNQGYQLQYQDNYFFGVKGSGTQSYGVEDWGSDSLMQNNICQHVIACEMVAASFGGVIAYNFASDCPWGAATLSNIQCNNLNHDMSAMLLNEGDSTNNMNTDNIHGMSYAITLFRNRFRLNDIPWKNNILTGSYNAAHTRGNNIINNVFGTRASELLGYERWQGYDGLMVYNLGYQAENFTIPPDPLVAKLVLRWGNYDICTDQGTTTTSTYTDVIPCNAVPGSNGIRFCGGPSNTGWATTCIDPRVGTPVSQIPGAGSFINANPIPTKGDVATGGAAFPASFYLSGPPAFWQTAWGTPGWPAIGSDVIASGPLDTTCPGNPLPAGYTSSTCDGVAHHSYQNPAQICWNNTPIDPAGTGAGGQAQQAYSIQSMPAPTTSLGVTTYTANIGTQVMATPGCSPAGGTPGYCMSTFTITGANPPDYNGTWMVSNATATSISWIRPSNLPLPAYVGGGVVNWPNVRLYNAASCYPVAYSGTVPPVPTGQPKIINGNGKITGTGKIT